MSGCSHEWPGQAWRVTFNSRIQPPSVDTFTTCTLDQHVDERGGSVEKMSWKRKKGTPSSDEHPSGRDWKEECSEECGGWHDWMAVYQTVPAVPHSYPSSRLRSSSLLWRWWRWYRADRRPKCQGLSNTRSYDSVIGLSSRCFSSRLDLCFTCIG